MTRESKLWRQILRYWPEAMEYEYPEHETAD